MFWSTVVAVSCVKLLLLPSYRSTDFEVHRNWLAITYSLPVSKWYYEKTSEWTLDYPPLFAQFEFVLSQAAKYFDHEMLMVDNLNYASPNTVLFQRLSVIITDLVFAFAVKECCGCVAAFTSRSSKKQPTWESRSSVLSLLLLGNAGLIIVDHIHFQYNGFLFGILLLSVARILQGCPLTAAFWFTVLLNLKHIFLYLAPAYFVYLLRSYCFKSRHDGSIMPTTFSITNFTKLGMVVVSVFAISFGPFMYMGQTKQVLQRLFPFKRGLCHAYWAPNFWAVYSAADKVATVIAVHLGVSLKIPTASMTGGLVQEADHAVLPSVTPLVTFICTTASILPAIGKLWCTPPNPWVFLRCLVLCAFGSFIFGWHVHEKAVLLIIIPMSVLAVVQKADARIYLLLAVTGHFSLFPLLFTAFETPVKLLLLLLHSWYAFVSLLELYNVKKEFIKLPLISPIESVYLLGLVPMFLYENTVHPLLGLGQNFAFLPLLLISGYCSLGIIYTWLKFYVLFLKSGRKLHEKAE